MTILLRGDDVQRLPNNLWLINGILVEIQTVTANDIGAPRARGIELLQKYKEWELQYTEKKNGWPALKTGEVAVKAAPPNIKTVTWGYEVPGSLKVLDQNVVRVMYVTAAVGEVVFVMSVPMRESDHPDAIGRALTPSLETIRNSAKPLNIAAFGRVEGEEGSLGRMPATVTPDLPMNLTAPGGCAAYPRGLSAIR